MKKLLGIVVLGLLLSGNANSEDLNLDCKNISHQNYYGIKVETMTRQEMINAGSGVGDLTYIINTNKKKILRQNYNGEFVPLSENTKNFNSIWSSYNIVWTHESNLFKDTQYKSDLNRSTGVLIDEGFYGEKSHLRKKGLTRTKSTYKCEISKKKF